MHSHCWLAVNSCPVAVFRPSTEIAQVLFPEPHTTLTVQEFPLGMHRPPEFQLTMFQPASADAVRLEMRRRAAGSWPVA